jgi:hypothetical protein
MKEPAASRREENHERIWGYQRWLVQCLAEGLLRRYRVAAPPVPVESMLADSHQAYWPTEPDLETRTRGSLGPRLRLEAAQRLYHHLRRSSCIEGATLTGETYADLAPLFARCLLMPARWMELVDDNDPAQLGETYRVPTDIAAMRLIELGLWDGDGEV